MALTDEDVQEILHLLDSSPYDELHLETDRFKLTLRRTASGGWTREDQTLKQPAVAASSQTAPAASGRQSTAKPRSSDDGLVDVPAPMMGTYYRAPKPGADPFVEVGSRVEKDTVIAIIEVMKLMNSIRAEVEGEVMEICVENGESVEQGQTLIRVKPDS